MGSSSLQCSPARITVRGAELSGADCNLGDIWKELV